MKVQGEHFAPSVPYIGLDVDDTPRRDTPQRSGAGGTHWASKAAIDLLGIKKGEKPAEGGIGESESGLEMLGDGDDDGKVEYDRTMHKARRIAEEGVERARQEMEEALLERARLREAAKKVASSEGGDQMDGQDDEMKSKRGKKSLEEEGRGGKRRGSQDDEVEARLKKRSERRGRQFEEPQSVIYMADENDDEDGNDVHSAKAKARALSIQVGGCLYMGPLC